MRLQIEPASSFEEPFRVYPTSSEVIVVCTQDGHRYTLRFDTAEQALLTEALGALSG